MTRVIDIGWHRITWRNGLAKSVAENCEKGMKVLVQGRPKAAEGDAPELVDRDDEVGF